MRALSLAATGLLLAAATSSSAMAADVGIPACDNILKTYTTCVIPKAPEASRAQMKASFDQMQANWTAVAATPAGRTELEPVCKKTADDLKQQLAPLGCQW